MLIPVRYLWTLQGWEQLRECDYKKPVVAEKKKFSKSKENTSENYILMPITKLGAHTNISQKVCGFLMEIYLCFYTITQSV